MVTLAMCWGVLAGSHGVAALSVTPFGAMERLPNGEFRMQVNGALEGFRIEGSTDLSTWQALRTLSGTERVDFVDESAPYRPLRFYRLASAGATGVVTGDHLPTGDGDVVIHPLRHATLVLGWNGKTIYVDPVAGIDYSRLPAADLVLVTHTHGDHLDAGTITSRSGPETPIVASRAVNNALSSTLRGRTTILGNGDSTEILGMRIEAVPAYNANHPKGQGNGYVLMIGGKRIYLSGDTGDTPELRALEDIDLAFLCMNVPYTLSVSEAVSVVRAFRPKVVYPYHYRNANGTFADLEDFKRRVGQDLGIEVRLRDWY